MKITIYDLLGLVKDGKAPKEIKYKNFVYGWVQKYKTYTRYDITGKDLYITTNNLNDEVEIIEEEPKPITKESIEALGYACGEIRKCFENGWNKSLENKPLIEEPKKIEKLDVALLGQCDNWLRCPKNKVTKQDVELNPYIIDNIRENTLYFQRKINELIDEINNLKEK